MTTKSLRLRVAPACFGLIGYGFFVCLALALLWVASKCGIFGLSERVNLGIASMGFVWVFGLPIVLIYAIISALLGRKLFPLVIFMIFTTIVPFLTYGFVNAGVVASYHPEVGLQKYIWSWLLSMTTSTGRVRLLHEIGPLAPWIFASALLASLTVYLVNRRIVRWVGI